MWVGGRLTGNVQVAFLEELEGVFVEIGRIEYQGFHKVFEGDGTELVLHLVFQPGTYGVDFGSGSGMRTGCQQDGTGVAQAVDLAVALCQQEVAVEAGNADTPLACRLSEAGDEEVAAHQEFLLHLGIAGFLQTQRVGVLEGDGGDALASPAVGPQDVGIQGGMGADVFPGEVGHVFHADLGNGIDGEVAQGIAEYLGDRTGVFVLHQHEGEKEIEGHGGL